MTRLRILGAAALALVMLASDALSQETSGDARREARGERRDVRRDSDVRAQVREAVREALQKVRRRVRTMSAAERKAVSERMRKYWAERRKAKAKVK